MRGRRPTGPSCVRTMDGSELARKRLEVILETLGGPKRIVDACDELGISEPRYHQLKEQLLRAALDALEPGPIGRPPRTLSADQQQIAALQQQLHVKEVELRAAQARAEIAVTLPRLAQEQPPPEKKTPRPTRGRKRSM